MLATVLYTDPLIPMPLRIRRVPWDHADWLFELKYDGFRALAEIDFGHCRLISRNLNTFASFQRLADEIGAAFPNTRAVLDGEMVCLDRLGRPIFKDLLYRRRDPLFIAFDAIFMDGQDLRSLALIDRKAKLESLITGNAGPILYANYMDSAGIALFQRACELDLEGIVAKHKLGSYTSDREASTWFKIRNRRYSQIIGREALFERDRHREPVPGWHTCDLACAEVDER